MLTVTVAVYSEEILRQCNKMESAAAASDLTHSWLHLLSTQ